MTKSFLALAACAALLAACGNEAEDAGPVVAPPTANEAVDTTPVGPGAPTAGASSYTEAQAKGAIEAAGFTDVGPLMQTPEGLWQGTATKDGSQHGVSVDYQGTVTSNF